MLATRKSMPRAATLAGFRPDWQAGSSLPTSGFDRQELVSLLVDDYRDLHDSRWTVKGRGGNSRPREITLDQGKVL